MAYLCGKCIGKYTIVPWIVWVSSQGRYPPWNSQIASENCWLVQMILSLSGFWHIFRGRTVSFGESNLQNVPSREWGCCKPGMPFQTKWEGKIPREYHPLNEYEGMCLKYYLAFGWLRLDKCIMHGVGTFDGHIEPCRHAVLGCKMLIKSGQ